jgi:hypothetical protein
LFTCIAGYAQNVNYELFSDSLVTINEEKSVLHINTLPRDSLLFDSLPAKTIKGDDFVPNSTKAVWYSAMFPGLGQIYNRKYWKLPIVYGSFVGISYGLAFNQRNYTDYAVAYKDLLDGDDTTNSYKDFVPESWSEEQIKNALRRKKDFYRRSRDLSIIGMVAMYAVCMIDAYVDAELYSFDISPDLSLKIAPAIMSESPQNALSFSYVWGLQCNLKFKK